MSKLGFHTLPMFLVFVGTTALAQAPGVADGTPTATATTTNGPRRIVRDPGETPRPTAPPDDDECMDCSLHVPPGPRPHRVGAVFAELGLGVLGAGVGTGLTYALVVPAVVSDSARAFYRASAVGALFTFALVDGAIYAGGELTDGRGSASWTTLGILLGAGVGTALGLGVVNALTRPTNGGFSAASVLTTIFAVPALGLAGGIVAYELSDGAERRRLMRGLALVPVAAPMHHGVSYGLAGRF